MKKKKKKFNETIHNERLSIFLRWIFFCSYFFISRKIQFSSSKIIHIFKWVCYKDLKKYNPFKNIRKKILFLNPSSGRSLKIGLNTNFILIYFFKNQLEEKIFFSRPGVEDSFYDIKVEIEMSHYFLRELKYIISLGNNYVNTMKINAICCYSNKKRKQGIRGQLT